MGANKVKLYQTTQNQVYSDEYGFVNGQISYCIDAAVNLNGRIIHQFSTVFIKTENGMFVPITNKELKEIFEIELYADRGYISPGLDRYVKISQIKDATISWQGKRAKATETGYDLLLNTDVYELPNRYQKNLLQWFEIRKEMPVIYCGTTWKVEEVFYQPNRENKLCKIISFLTDKCAYISRDFQLMDAEGIHVVGNSAKTPLYRVPYGEYTAIKNELDIFNEEIREREMDPVFILDEAGEAGNLFWHPVDESCGYVISVYKYRPADFVEKKLYLLEKRTIERTQCWCTLENLIGNNYIVRIEAENRGGQIIAKSRGIAIKSDKYKQEENEPKYWSN